MNSQTKKILYVSLFIFFGLLVIIFFVRSKFLALKLVSQSASKTEIDTSSTDTGEVSKLSGQMFFTSFKKGDVLPEPYILDIETKKVSQSGLDSEQLGYFHTFNNFKKNIVFVGTTKKEITEAIKNKSNAGDVFQIYLGKMSAKGELPVVSDSVKLTTNILAGKKMPELSPNGKTLLYLTQEVAKSKDPKSLDGFKVHIVNLDDKSEKVIASATSPYWVNSESFIFLDKKGINLSYIDSTASSTILLAMQGINNMKLAVSNSGDMFAVSIPDSKKIFLFKIDGKEIKPAGEISELAYWLVFSPDGSVLSIQTIQNSDDNKSKPLISFYNVKNLKKQDSDDILLNEFDNEGFFLTAWK